MQVMESDKDKICCPQDGLWYQRTAFNLSRDLQVLER